MGNRGQSSLIGSVLESVQFSERGSVQSSVPWRVLGEPAGSVQSSAIECNRELTWDRTVKRTWKCAIC